jgi:hypothetical protein
MAAEVIEEKGNYSLRETKKGFLVKDLTDGVPVYYNEDYMFAKQYFDIITKTNTHVCHQLNKFNNGFG